jgi:hypothetical protein
LPSIKSAATLAYDIYRERPSEQDARGVEPLLWQGKVPTSGLRDL